MLQIEHILVEKLNKVKEELERLDLGTSQNPMEKVKVSSEEELLKEVSHMKLEIN